MGNRAPFAPFEFYHLYNRGTEKRSIFSSKYDYERFILLLYLCNSTEPLHLKDSRGRTSGEMLVTDRGDTLVDIAAFCLMPNHFHILAREKEDTGISKFMQKLITGYTMYFNKKHERTGALFQGKFRSEHVSEDRYLKYLLSYIHLNPVKLIDSTWKEKGLSNIEETKKYLNSYVFSSFLEYSGKGSPYGKLINKTVLPEYFTSAEECNKEILEWLNFSSIPEVRPRRRSKAA